MGRERHPSSAVAKEELASSFYLHMKWMQRTQQFTLKHLKHESDTHHVSLTPGEMGKNTRCLADIYFSFLIGTENKTKSLQFSAASSTADLLARQAINTLSRKQENSLNDCNCRAASGFSPSASEPKENRGRSCSPLWPWIPARWWHTQNKQPDVL